MPITTNFVTNDIPMYELPKNVFAVITEDCGYHGIVFRPVNSSNFVFISSLNDGTVRVDGFSPTCSIRVRPLTKGESFNVVI